MRKLNPFTAIGRLSITTLLLVLASITTLRAQNSSIIAKGAKLQLISNQFSFTEGPSVDKKGNIFFTDQPNNKIWEYSVDGKLSVFMDRCGRSNGTYFDRKGNLITCADRHDQLWSISPDKKVTVLVNNFEGHRLNGPNDLWIDPKGGIYFTDPYYQRPYWKRTKKDIQQERVYYLTPDKKQVIVVANDLVKPNGIIGTPDGKKLYVADIGASKTYVYTINSDGTLSNKTLFSSMGSDGMTIDNKGNIYLTGNGVTVFDKSGKQIAHIPVDQKWTANITFGGRNRHTLFITASHGLYSLKMKVKGVK
ncbi:MAG: SMP-30/gluconolactonase/LRE family protein [Bacteroidales bacterium]|nr:SMP-30/gluconolactonase/LRE family protein [Bacteroidales bacterium]